MKLVYPNKVVIFINKRNEVLINAIAWVNLENMLRESQS